MNRTILIAVIVLLILGGGTFFFLNQKPSTSIQLQPSETADSINNDSEIPDETITEEKEPTSGAVIGDEAKEFTVIGSPFKYEPAEIKVKKGDKVKITFKNEAGFHDLVIDGFNVKTKQLAAGASEVLTFTADKVGTFEYYCSVGNHRAQGMVGKLIVE